LNYVLEQIDLPHTLHELYLIMWR